jgi:choline kinase
MQAIILAAGLAKRLRPLTDDSPKCLLPFGEKNLLHYTVENIIANGINEFIVVTGYRENMIKNYLREHFSELNITILTNSDFANNNNSYSLWMTKDYVKDDVLLLDSDIFFDKMIITKLLHSGYENCLAVNITEKLDEEQIKVRVDDKKRILEIGKEVNLAQASGESIGIEKFSKPCMDEMFKILDRKILKEKNVSEFYEVTFQEALAARRGKDERNSIYCVDVSNYRCMEIDTVDDYNHALKLI